MAGKEFDFVGKFGWEEGWEIDFSKIKVLETSALFINMVLESLLNIFGGGKDQLFDVLVRVFPVSPETDLVKLKKNFLGTINYYYIQKKKMVPTLLHITLGIVLKLFKMLLECMKSQDYTSNELGTQTNEDKWKAESRELLEWEGE